MKNQDKLDGMVGILKDGKAPAVGGRPHFAKDMDLVRSLGVRNIGDLIGRHVNDKSPGADGVALPVINFGRKDSAGMLPEETRLRLFHLKKMWNNCEIQAQIMNPRSTITADMMKATPLYKAYLGAMLKDFNVDDFSSWVPVITARFHFEEYEIEHILMDQFEQLPMDSKTMEVPGWLGHLDATEATDGCGLYTPKTLPQSSYLVNACDAVSHVCVGQDLISDSAIPFLNVLRTKLLKGVARAIDNSILNADTTITTSVRGDGHLDSDTRALVIADTFLKCYDGLRRRVVNNDAAIGPDRVWCDHGGGAPDKTLFETTLKKMGCQGVNKKSLRWIFGCSIDSALVSGAIPELFTAFAVGGLASNITGEVPPVFGIKTVTSEFAREDLNASGVYDGVTTDLTSLLLVNTERFKLYQRQATRLWASPSLPNSDSMLVTAKWRGAFAGVPQSADEISITGSYNIAT